MRIPKVWEGEVFPKGLSYKCQKINGRLIWSVHLRLGRFIWRLGNSGYDDLITLNYYRAPKKSHR